MGGGWPSLDLLRLTDGYFGTDLGDAASALDGGACAMRLCGGRSTSRRAGSPAASAASRRAFSILSSRRTRRAGDLPCVARRHYAAAQSMQLWISPLPRAVRPRAAGWKPPSTTTVPARARRRRARVRTTRGSAVRRRALPLTTSSADPSQWHALQARVTRFAAVRVRPCAPCAPEGASSWATRRKDPLRDRKLWVVQRDDRLVAGAAEETGARRPWGVPVRAAGAPPCRKYMA
jgi:hypothetical protein